FMTDEDVVVFNGMKEAISDNKCAALFYAFPYLRTNMLHFSMHFLVGLFIGLFVDLTDIIPLKQLWNFMLLAGYMDIGHRYDEMLRVIIKEQLDIPIHYKIHVEKVTFHSYFMRGRVIKRIIRDTN
ncbi:hypothetical protein ACJX0J_037886, partial [Zea mays]